MKFLVTLLIALVTFATADAAKVDIYRNAILNKTFTLKYKVNEFPIHVVNKEAKFTFGILGKANISNKDNSEIKEPNTGGIIVFNKDDRYFENFHDSFTTNFERKINKPSSGLSGLFGVNNVNNEKTILKKENVKAGGEAILYKNGETFKFYFRLNSDGTKDYFSRNMWGIKSNKIRATSEKDAEKMEKYINPYEKLFNDYNFGNPDLYQALEPILPPTQIIVTPNTPTYKFVGTGNLDNGLTYEDFYGEKNNFHSAIRYYFSGDKMVKIAMFDYLKNENSVQSYEKHIIEIEEFLTTPDEHYLKLPETLQDKTKRNEDGGEQ